MKITTLLNISACYIKTQDYKEAITAANHVLMLEKDNSTALWRRAKARSLPINAQVKDFTAAIADLKKLKERKRVTKEIERLDAIV
jgi:hypothetical protein